MHAQSSDDRKTTLAEKTHGVPFAHLRVTDSATTHAYFFLLPVVRFREVGYVPPHVTARFDALHMYRLSTM
ncbi:hypothetical protein QHI69_19845 [Burkholderia gladioli pv. gladioli]|uniref:hypothetical protein n=1 Tax=Burkholderia gladioli TaxID=28095 RepID=UPI000A85B0AC|nr:hypothetical protein [Burkholderia gladioli]MDJ1164139.1 hypothetical protein [Burkholderia gladioli pv. gladioli]QPQ84244.1 hypothetical protein I6H08_04050 [Burkholderia gladioli]